MIKILLIANTDWFLYNFRKSLANFLRKNGYDVVLISPPGEYSHLLLDEGFAWIPWKLSRKGALPWEEFYSLLSLVKIYKEERPDIVHHHTIKPVLYGTLVAKLVGISGIVNSITGRGYIFLSGDIFARFLQAIIKPIYSFLLKLSYSSVIFENQFDYNYFIEMGMVQPEQSWLIEGVGADPEKYYPVPEPEKTPVVLFAGRMLWDKGVGVFVEAARILKPEVEAQFVLVGEPDLGNPGAIDESQLLSWQDEGVIDWWGWQSNMVSVYQHCHVVALPTKYGEGVPTSLIEAAACGKPLVAGDVPGCQTIVVPELNGFLVPPDDPKALAMVLGEMIVNPELRKKMGEASRNLFLDKFTYHHVNEATIRVYESLLRSESEQK